LPPKNGAMRTNTLSEHQIQASAIAELKLRERLIPELKLLYAIPNGKGSRVVTRMTRNGPVKYCPQGLKAKREGQKAGIPDLHWPVARGPYIGLYIEVKTPTGTLSADQKNVIPALKKEGHQVLVAKSADEIVTFVMEYAALGGHVIPTPP